MAYLAHTAHKQFLGLVVGILGWILILCSAGINEWRLWYVSDMSLIPSGVAWVGVWRACFYSRKGTFAEHCTFMGISESFLPVEIVLAQVLVMFAVVLGLLGNLTAGYAMRKVYFGLGKRRLINIAFWCAGSLYLVSATCAFVPLFMNMAAVLKNDTIHFPEVYNFPPAPSSQGVGTGIGVGIAASAMITLSGLLFLCYKYPKRVPQHGSEGREETNGHLVNQKVPPSTSDLRSISEDQEESSVSTGVDNQGFELQENS